MLIMSILIFGCCISPQSISEEEAKRETQMTNVLGVVGALFRSAIRKAYPSFTQTQDIVQRSAKFGDYQCVAAMPIANVSGWSVH